MKKRIYKPIRILHMIGGLNLGGSQTFVMNLYRNIDREKIQFDFILDHSSERFFEDEVLKLGGKIYDLPAFNGTNMLTVKSSWKKFLNDHPEYRILHSHIRSYASLYIPIAKRKGIVTIIHSHSISNGTGLKSIMKSILQFPLRFQADYFWACSLEAGRWLFGEKVCKSKKFKVVKNGILVDEFIYDKLKRHKIREEFNLSQNDKVIGFIGRIAEPKNPLFIIEVFEEIFKLDRKVKLLIVGEGDMCSSVKKLVHSKGLDTSVIFAGGRNDANALLSAMDVFIFPSFWEGLGISLIEAQASGIQCYCSENIPSSAIITNLVTVLELDKGAKEWALRIVNDMKGEMKRENHSKEIIDLGYDVKETSLFVQDFYTNIYNSLKC